MINKAIAANAVLASVAVWLMVTLNASLAPTSIAPTFGVLVEAWIVWFALGAFVTVLPAAIASE